jgi:DNA-binding NarL/FixJ family response regulator
MSGASIRVLVADDQRTVRDGLAMLVGLIDGVEVVGTACDGIEAVERARSGRPDIVLMDLRMPRMEGIEATRQIRTELPDTHVLVLTTYADDESLFPALQAGARGYLTKDASAEEIEQAIKALGAGQTHLDPACNSGSWPPCSSAGSLSGECSTRPPLHRGRALRAGARATSRVLS